MASISDKNLENMAINTIRFLSADAINQANSGHPGLPMGTAALAYTLWTRFLKHNPGNPNWANRDRFVLSGGHGSMLLYSLLHLTGYELSLDEIKNFRQWQSLTPGHPEYGHTPGIENTTGPLGQGFGNGVGMAIAETILAARFNSADHKIFDYNTYAIVTDGDLMEGVTSEAASLAGHLKLGKLIYIYDDNHISIDGSTDLTFSENRQARFDAYGWHTQQVEDGNDVEAIDSAIRKAQQDDRPSLIIARTQIGFGLPNRAGTAQAHGEPPGEEEITAARKQVNWPAEKFHVPEEALKHYRLALDLGKNHEQQWDKLVKDYVNVHTKNRSELERVLAGELPKNWDVDIPKFETDPKGMATRVSSGKVINAIADNLPDLVGGSADLHPSTKTFIDSAPAYSERDRAGRSLHYGVREHGMGAIVNGLSLAPGIIPFGATFFVFSDYMRPSIRLSALSGYPSIWVFTHDSVGVGEDGPTHQPVEHLAAMRAIPNLNVIRPADANEVAEAWKAAIFRRDGPTALALTRQSLPTLDRSKYSSAKGLHKGAYVLSDLGGDVPDLILIATGSELAITLDAGLALEKEGIKVRVVSMPSWELFEQQAATYQNEVLPPDINKRLAVETGISQGWHKWIGQDGDLITLDKYGASAPATTLMQEFGFTTENIIVKAKKLLNVG
jgi:transketolase